MSIDTQNSWYMSKPLSDCPNLFPNKETINYQAHFYHCQCGGIEVILSSNTETPLYQCKECSNTHFINALNVKKGYFYLQQNENLNLIYDCKKIYDGYIVNAYLNIPYQVDFMRKKLLYKKEFIANLILSTSNKKHIYNLPVEHFKEKNILKIKIRHFINIDCGNNLYYFKDDLYEEKVIYPFYFYPYPIDGEFYFWKKIDLRALRNPKKSIGVVDMLHYLLNHRKERSLKMILFKKYTQLLKHSPHPDTFNPLAPFVISRCFDDPNIASKLLSKDLEIFSLEDASDYNAISFVDGDGMKIPSIGKLALPIFINLQIWFIKFLKIHYTENKLAIMFLNQHDNAWSLWTDILLMVAGNKRTIKKGFEKVKLSFENIHDEIVHCTNAHENKKLNNLHFSYEDNYEQACKKIGNIEFRLPYSGKELGIWAEDMHNCISWYGLDIKDRYTTIFGAFRDDKMLYAIEASPSEIHEMSGKHNSEISTPDANIINLWWKKYLYQKW